MSRTPLEAVAPSRSPCGVTPVIGCNRDGTAADRPVRVSPSPHSRCSADGDQMTSLISLEAHAHALHNGRSMPDLEDEGRGNDFLGQSAAWASSMEGSTTDSPSPTSLTAQLLAAIHHSGDMRPVATRSPQQLVEKPQLIVHHNSIESLRSSRAPTTDAKASRVVRSFENVDDDAGTGRHSVFANRKVKLLRYDDDDVGDDDAFMEDFKGPLADAHDA